MPPGYLIIGFNFFPLNLLSEKSIRKKRSLDGRDSKLILVVAGISSCISRNFVGRSRSVVRNFLSSWLASKDFFCHSSVQDLTVATIRKFVKLYTCTHLHPFGIPLVPLSFHLAEELITSTPPFLTPLSQFLVEFR